MISPYFWTFCVQSKVLGVFRYFYHRYKQLKQLERLEINFRKVWERKGYNWERKGKAAIGKGKAATVKGFSNFGKGSFPRKGVVCNWERFQ